MHILSLFYLFCVFLCIAGGGVLLFSSSLRLLLSSFLSVCFGVSGLLWLAGALSAAFMQLFVAGLVLALTLLQFFIPLQKASPSSPKKLGITLAFMVVIIGALVEMIQRRGRHLMGETAPPLSSQLQDDSLSILYGSLFILSVALTVIAIFSQRPRRGAAFEKELRYQEDRQ